MSPKHHKPQSGFSKRDLLASSRYLKKRNAYRGLCKGHQTQFTSETRTGHTQTNQQSMSQQSLPI